MEEFFEPPAPLPKVDLSEPDPSPWEGPEKDALPSGVALAEVVAKSESVVVGIGGVLAYPTGFQIQVRVVALTDEGVGDPFFGHEPFGDGEIPEQLLRVGFEYEDGRRSMNTRSRWHDGGEDEGGQAPTMISQGGSGGVLSWSQKFWCWPLPGAGAIQFVCEWPTVGIGLTKREIDGQAITAAAAEAVSMLNSA